MSKDTRAKFQFYWEVGCKKEAFMVYFMEHFNWSDHCHKLSQHWEQIEGAQSPADFQPIVREILS
jgi:hypothetical protein